MPEFASLRSLHSQCLGVLLLAYSLLQLSSMLAIVLLVALTFSVCSDLESKLLVGNVSVLGFQGACVSSYPFNVYSLFGV